MATYTLNLSDPVVFSDEQWTLLSNALGNAHEFLASEAFTGAGNNLQKALGIMDAARMRRTDGFAPQGTTVGQATLRHLETQLEQILSLAFRDMEAALDRLSTISATLSDLYFEQND